jgi:8-oxo-dGTP pyrophosphatase MutT (NUDIX family)
MNNGIKGKSVNSVNKIIYCVNCGKKGHKIKNCNYPIVSYGIICIKLNIDNNIINLNDIIEYLNNTNNTYNTNNINFIDKQNNIKKYYELLKKDNNYDNIIKYLLINRKFSLNYVELIRGKYDIMNMNYLINSINYITVKEKNIILKESFDTIWNNLWNNKFLKNEYDNEYEKSKSKFNLLKNGIINNYSILNFENIINKSKFNFDETEWEFPKGRKNLNENENDCAKREFFEETNIDINSIDIINIDNIEEIFMGTNYSKYKNIYTIGQLNNNIEIDMDLKNEFQVMEINDIKWMSIDECFNKIRDYHFEKKNTLHYLHFTICNLINVFLERVEKNI